MQGQVFCQSEQIALCVCVWEEKNDLRKKKGREPARAYDRDRRAE